MSTRHTRSAGSTANAASSDVSSRLGQAVLDALGEMPRSHRHGSHQPGPDSQRVARIAAGKAGLAAGTLALPLGPLGWLTLLPEMAAVWKIQAQMVADIAALHGRRQPLTQEELLYCLFRHATGQLLRDLVVRVGERSLVQRASLHALRLLALRIGTGLAKRLAGKGLARWVPVAGAVGVGAYAFWDTRQVASTAIELFASEVIVQELPASDTPPRLAHKTPR